MIDENPAKGLKLQFGLQVDEMSIKKSVEWDGKKYHGQVDLGLENEEFEEATYALVYMIVSLNGYFKTPIAYYFIRSLTADVRANITNQILIVLHDNGITDIRSMTFDGAATNLGMVKHLGANIQNFEDCFFKHPITKSCIVVVPDSCHMLKLVRNTSEFDLIDKNGNHIQWRYLEKLVEHQENEHLHLGTKIRRRHIQYQKEKMKVKLAAQIFSNRVSDALLFLKDNFPDKFTGTEATATYCKKINDIFDFLNSRRKFEKYSMQNCITIENLTETENRVNEYIDYIKNLKIVEDKVSNKVTPILMSKHRTGFWGLIIGMKSALKLARYVFEQKLMTYLLTFKLSQDHLETFFSCIRRMGGFNNNPTCRQFRPSYKKLVTHVNSIIPDNANCIQQDNTKLLKCANLDLKYNDNSTNEEELVSIAFEHDYVGCNSWAWNEYNSEIVTYISGFIVKYY